MKSIKMLLDHLRFEELFMVVSKYNPVFAAVAAIAAICTLVAFLVDVAVHEKALSVIMFLLAFVPILAALLMLMVLLYSLFVMYSRRDSIKLTLDIRNRDVFDSYGIKLTPSEDFEWIVAEIRNKKAGMVAQKTLKIGSPKKNPSGAPAQDTSQGLLGNLEGVDFDDDRI